MSGEPDDAPSDAELLQAHVSGDPDAFAILFSRHRDRLWAVALRTMGNPHDAADGLQDGLISAFRRADSFRGDAAVTTWLHRVVVNACLDRLRAAKVRRTEPLPDSNGERRPEDYLDRGSPAHAVTADPAEAAVAGERRRAVLIALGTLPIEQRAALVLVDMEGYPVADVALMLDVAEGTVKSRCSRGRAKLAELLGVLREDSEIPPSPVSYGNPQAPPTVRPDGTEGGEPIQ